MMRYIVPFLMIIMMVSCKSEPKYPKTNLLKYGFAVDINAPADAVIKADDLGIMKEVTVISGDAYNVQILKSTTTTTDVSKGIADQKSLVKSDAYFSKFLEENDNGFIFEKDIDGNINYDFRYIKILGDQEYIYQTGMVGTYTEEAVREMYQSVQ